MEARATAWIGVLGISAALLLQACGSASTGEAPAPARALAASAAGPAPFQKGIAFAAWWQGHYASPEADRSLAALAATGADWVAIVVTGYQHDHASTAIRRDLPRSPTDADLIHAIDAAHALGLRVMLKPHVDLDADPGHWRADIGTGFTKDSQWRAWFGAYRRFIDHYALLAQLNAVEQLCVGTELAGTTAREQEWRTVVRGVRQRFSGPITYASNHGGEELAIRWWDAVDYIGIDAYYPLAEAGRPDVDQLTDAWTNRGYIDRLRALSERYDRPILLTEIGYRSVEGATTEPWRNHPASVDLQDQAKAYAAALNALWGRPWLAGMYWWNWDADPTKGGERDDDFTPHNKPAEAVLRGFYR